MQWTHQATLLLISKRQEKDHLFQINTADKQAWGTVACSLRESGYTFSADECSDKFQCLKLRYTDIKDEHYIRGKSRCNWPYFDLLDAMFKSDPAIVPVAPVASMPWPSSSSAASGVREEDGEVEQARNGGRTRQVQRRGRKRTRSDEPDWFKTFRDDLKKMHMERMEVEKQRLEIERQRLAVLKQLLEYLKQM